MTKYKKIYIEITNRCNLHCSFCSKVEKEIKDMSIEEFELILDRIKDYTDYIYLHVKGEPLLHKNIIEMINLADKYNIKVNLTTNGTLYKDNAKQLGSCNNLNKINFSLHSENNSDNYFKDIFDNIKYLNKNTTVIYRIWTLNNNKLDKESTKIVNNIIDYYGLSTNIVEKINCEQNIKISKRIYIDKDNKFTWPIENEYKSHGYCYALKTQIAILVDGTVIPCCLDSNGKIELGNIFKQDLEDIINSERYQNLKKSFSDRKPCESLCKSCTFKERFN